MDAKTGPGEAHGSFAFTLGLERVGLLALKVPRLTAVMVVLFSVLAAWGVTRLKVDDSLSELFRTNTEEFRRYEEIDRRFPSSEYDVLVVVEGKDLLKKPQIEAFRRAIVDLQLADGVEGLVSMLSARGKPDAGGYAAPIVPDDLPDGPAYDEIIKSLRANEIVTGKFLSPDGELALAVVALDRKAVAELGAKAVIGNLRKTVEDEVAPVGLTVQLTGAPVMQLEIRNAVERDQLALQRARPAVRRDHRRGVLPPRVADADGGAAAGAGRAVVARAARPARTSSSTCSSTS